MSSSTTFSWTKWKYQRTTNLICEEAQRLFESSRAIREQVYRADHMIHAATYQALGALKRILAAFDDAREQLELARQIRETSLDANHPAQASILAALATLEQELANYEAARALHIRALAIREDAYGLEAELGEMEQARTWMRQSWKILLDKLGAQHTRTTTCSNWLDANDPEFPDELTIISSEP